MSTPKPTAPQLSQMNDCECLEAGSDGTTTHSDPSGLKFVSNYKDGEDVITSPCQNHVANYRSSDWFVPVLITPLTSEGQEKK